MASVKIVGTLGPNSQFALAAKKKGGEILLGRLQNVAAEVAIETNKLTRSMYQTRSGERRHLQGPHLVGSFYCVVEGSTFPVTLTLRSRASAAKVIALNDGTPAHRIPNPGTGGWLKFPRSPPRGPQPAKFVPSPYAARQAIGGAPFRFKKDVQHPGIAPGQFMEDAMTRVIRRTLHRSIVLKDRRNAALRV